MRAKMGGVVSKCNLPSDSLAARHAPRHNFSMRFLFGVLVGAAIFFLAYHFYLKRMPSTDEGTAATQAISLTGVRMDLLQIADAEHGFIATNGHCASLDELISTNSVSMTHTERDGYSYAVQCSGNGFTATAHHRPAPAGSLIRYPNFSIDESLDLHEID
jgi:hypothetical protein